MKKIRLEEFNEHEIQEAKIDKALLAVGSTESHGGHLPFGCDTFVSYDIALETAARLDNAVVVPPLWYGMSLHYRHKPMCISLASDTLTQVVREVMESLVFWGIRKILIVNGHDGNIASIEIAARDMKVKYPEIGLAVLDAWWVTAGNLLPKDTFEVWDGLGHGGEGETSIALAIFPHLVDLSRAKGMIPDMDPNVKLIWNFEELTDYGASGAPEKATEEKGRKMKQVLVDYLVDFVKRMDRQGWRYAKA
ncbi:MAG: creatininase family protein [Deltaproteobacteria bacterium]|nr:creatininase family protein [Deltaproteobacteria bacterium]MBW1956188.1 creatininase family protein [Deltaproteobacteria bacterium]MBW2042955.1 creatininase family protein [Deltaproteobacteria bacterium]MBW2132546.1 creatininase family protein [Deltaproteobacteria bacterium]